MSKGDTFESDILKYLFNDVSLGLAANVTVALHTADPGDTGTQLTSEAAYTGYARVSVSRSGTGGFTITGSSMSPTADITFGACTASPGAAITHASIGTGTGNKLMYKGALSPSITMGVGVIPVIKTTSTITED